MKLRNKNRLNFDLFQIAWAKFSLTTRIYEKPPAGL